MISGVLLDLGGVVYAGDQPLPGALAALERLHAAELPLRYLTNTTRKSRRMLVEHLQGLGIAATPEEVFMPAIAARRLIAEGGYAPQLLVHPNLEEDFAGLASQGRPALVVGDAAEGFTFAAMNRAFRSLQQDAAFFALAHNRSFLDADGELTIDAGAFVVALEYASQRQATVLGKPAAEFFTTAVATLGCPAEDAVMIGDDAENDVAGAQAVGLTGILVKTGKYRDGDEARLATPPDAVLADLPAAVDWILERR